MFQTSVNTFAPSVWGEMIKEKEFSRLDVSVPTAKAAATRGRYGATR